jgi:hypothetical protein
MQETREEIMRSAYLSIAKKWNYSSSPLRAQLMFANKQIELLRSAESKCTCIYSE